MSAWRGYEPLPKLAVKTSIAKRIDSKREAAKQFLGSKWLGVAAPPVSHKKRLTDRQKRAKESVLGKFGAKK